MQKGRFSEAQSIAILQQQASGQTVAQIVREHSHVLCLVSRPAVAVQVKLIIRSALYRPRW